MMISKAHFDANHDSAAGKYSCEVVADKTFLTLIKEAHMQVVGKICSWCVGGVKTLKLKLEFNSTVFQTCQMKSQESQESRRSIRYDKKE